MQSAFSHSSLTTFENCPKQYHFRYVEKIRVETESIEAFLGKRVHEVLERLYRFVDDGMLPSLERVLYRYRQNWEAGYDPRRVRIVRNGADEATYRGLGARCLSNYYRRNYPFDGDETLGIEEPVSFELDAAGHYVVRGIIDRVARAPDGALEIHDFKTGRRIPSQGELDRDRQLALYEMAMRSRMRGENEVRLVWHYVLHDEVRSSTRSPDQLDVLRRETVTLIDTIRREREWPARPGPLCNWCEYREMCPASGADRSRAPLPDSADSAAEVAREIQLRLL